MTDIPDFPALVELASRLAGKDKKTCELALYTLKKQDDRIRKLQDQVHETEKALDAFHKDPESPDAYVLRYKAIASKAINEQVDLREKYETRIAALEAALKPFADVQLDDFDEDKDEVASPFLTVSHLRAARAALENK